MHKRQMTPAASRREFLAKAGLGCGALALTDLLHSEGIVGAEQSNPLAERQPHFKPRAKAVIWLFQTGSPSQVDTFDYKPELIKRSGTKLAGADPKTGFFTTSGKCLKSPFKWNRHGQSGAYVTEILPNIAKHADDISFVYSCYSRSNNHTPAMLELNGGMIRQGFPSMGSWLSYGLGSSNSNLPAFVVMHGTKPRGADPIWSAGFLPSVYQATSLDSRGARPIDNLDLPGEISKAQQRSLLDELNAANRKHAEKRPFDRDLNARLESFELAYRMQAAAPEAFKLGEEPAETHALYGVDDPKTNEFGRKCLLARRLVERGVRFVQIYSGGHHNDNNWDAHGDLKINHDRHAGRTDKPIAGLIKDLKRRGMLDETLIVWTGEFGRQPTAEYAEGTGRDHNSYGFTLWLAGGGIKGGTSVGETDELGSAAVTDRFHVKNLHATVLTQLGFDPNALSFNFGGLDQRLVGVEGAEPIHQLI